MYEVYDYKFQFHNVGKRGIDFQPSDEDTSGDIRYYGFISYSGAWLIMKMDVTTPAAITYRYAAGKSGYTIYWVAKADLEYVTFDQISSLVE